MQDYLLDITLEGLQQSEKLMSGNFLIPRQDNPNARHYVQKIENAIKSIVLSKAISLNLWTSGTLAVDGHDVIHLVPFWGTWNEISGPKLLHVLTRKENGFAMAERTRQPFHSPGKFDKNTGEFSDWNIKRDSATRYRKYLLFNPWTGKGQ